MTRALLTLALLAGCASPLVASRVRLTVEPDVPLERATAVAWSVLRGVWAWENAGWPPLAVDVVATARPPVYEGEEHRGVYTRGTVYVWAGEDGSCPALVHELGHVFLEGAQGDADGGHTDERWHRWDRLGREVNGG